MDLILLEPGNQLFMPDEGRNAWSVSEDWASAVGPDALLKPSRCIELISVHQGMKRAAKTDATSNDENASHPVLTEFTCVKYVDKLSAKLYDLCLRGESLGCGIEQPTRIYLCRNTGGLLTSIMTYELRDAIISEIQFQTHPDDMATEQFKLAFTEALWSCNTPTADRTTGPIVKLGWSLFHQKSIVEFS